MLGSMIIIHIICDIKIVRSVPSNLVKITLCKYKLSDPLATLIDAVIFRYTI